MLWLTLAVIVVMIFAFWATEDWERTERRSRQCYRCGGPAERGAFCRRCRVELRGV